MKKLKLLSVAFLSFFSVVGFSQEIDVEKIDLNGIYNVENVVNYDSIVFNISKSPRVVRLLKSFMLNAEDPQWSQTVCRFLPIRSRKSTVANARDFWYSFPEVDEMNDRLSIPSIPARFRRNSLNSYSEGYYYNLMNIFLRLINEDHLKVYEHDVKKSEGLAQYNVYKKNALLNYISEKSGVDIPTTNKVRAIKSEDFEYISNQVIGYELQEVWYFDSRTTEFRKDIVAISPLILDKDRNPVFLFTMSMEDISPYLMLLHIQHPGKYNDFSMSYFSYFSKTMYSGPILRIPNPRGELLVDYILPKNSTEQFTAEQLMTLWEQESDQIEKKIRTIENRALWAIPSIKEAASLKRIYEAKMLLEREEKEQQRNSKVSKNTDKQ